MKRKGHLLVVQQKMDGQEEVVPGGGLHPRGRPLEDREWEPDLRTLVMECQARGRHMMEEWRLEEEQGADHDMVKKTVGMLAEEDARVGAWLAAMQKAEDLDSEETFARKATEEEVFLQTKTYALVRKEVEKWRPSMVEEGAALLNSGVIRAINQREAEALKKEALEKGIPYDRVPGKAVFTRKAATGRRKCRGVACTNFMSERPAADTYAGGIDASQVRAMVASQVRAMVAAGAQRGWTLAGVDVKTAFLQVPPGRSKDIVVAIFQECQITEPGELWAVEGSVYGLTTSPKDWANHRDETMGAINWEMEDDEGTWACWFEKTKEVNLWRIKSSRHGQDETVGYMAVYIDDLLITGDRGAVAATLLKIRQVWDTSDPEWLSETEDLRFCGFEFSHDEQGIRMHQESYTADLLDRHHLAKGGTLGGVGIPEEEGLPSPEDVRQAQVITGELLWLSSRTRPDITYAVAVMGQWTTKRPRGVTRIGEKVLQYLWRTSPLRYQRLGAGDYGPDHQQHRERRRDAVEAYADASFGAHEHKSISGLAVYYSGCPVFWATTRQACIALSTAESELAALIEAWTALRGVGGLVEELEEKPAELRLYSDSNAALAIVNGSSGSWRTRHLRIRAAALSEAVKLGDVQLQHVPGQSLVADGFTKQLGASPFGRFKESLGLYGGRWRAVRARWKLSR